MVRSLAANRDSDRVDRLFAIAGGDDQFAALRESSLGVLRLLLYRAVGNAARHCYLNLRV